MPSFFNKLRSVLQRQSSKIKFPREQPYAQTGPGFYLSQFHGNQRLASSIFEQSMMATADRMMRMRDYDAMDLTPLVSTALNTYADDAVTYNEYDQILTITSSSAKVKEELEYLFNFIVDIEGTGYYKTRNVCKYGDGFDLLNIEPGKGITGVISLPTPEIEREEAFDGNPNSVRFRWLAQQAGYFDEVQIAHYRLRGDDLMLPYGRSILESGRRSWKQLQLLEDAMLIYRVSRASEKRVFHIEIAGLPPEQSNNYLEAAKSKVKTEQIINPQTGEIDLRYRNSALTDDYWFLKRGEMQSTVETLPGATNLNDIEDVEYIQQQLITSLGVPKAFLQFSDDLEGKSSASKVDIRFARSIQRIQKEMITTFSRMAIIHLASKGFKEDEIYNFNIKMNNPSAIMELGKLEIMEKRADIFKKYTDESKIYSIEKAKKEIMHLTAEEIKNDTNKLIASAKFTKLLKGIEEGTEQNPQNSEQSVDSLPLASDANEDGTSKILDDMENDEKEMKSSMGQFNTIKKDNQGDLNVYSQGSKKSVLDSVKNRKVISEDFSSLSLKKYFNIKDENEEN